MQDANLPKLQLAYERNKGNDDHSQEQRNNANGKRLGPKETQTIRNRK